MSKNSPAFSLPSIGTNEFVSSGSRSRGYLIGIVLALALTIGFLFPSHSSAAARSAVKSAAATGAPARLTPQQLKIVTYMPSDAGWEALWTRYSHTAVEADMSRIASLNANTVRVAIQPLAVGFPKLTDTGAAEIADLVATAEAHGLSVQFTLFDHYNPYADVPRSTIWLHSVLDPYVGDPRIVLVELQNEMNFAVTGADSWARQMLAILPSILPNVPRTISLKSNETAVSAPAVSALFSSFGPSLVDVVNVHYYGHGALMLTDLKPLLQAAQSVAAGRPVIIGESGIPSLAVPTKASERNQVQFFALADAITRSMGIPAPGVWALNDFTSKVISTDFTMDIRNNLGSSEARYGLRRTDGTWKPDAEAVKAMFGSTTVAPDLSAAGTDVGGYGGLDSNFEAQSKTPDATNSYGSWSLTGSANVASASIQDGAGQYGQPAAVLTGTAAAGVVPAFFSNVLLLGTGPLTLSASTKLVNQAGANVRIALAWFSATGAYLGQSESPSADRHTNINWQSLSVTATPPANAAWVQVNLKSSNSAGTAYFGNVKLIHA